MSDTRFVFGAVNGQNAATLRRLMGVWSRRDLLICLAVALLSFMVNLGIVYHMAPNPNEPLPKGPIYEGIYRCCSQDGPKYRASRVERTEGIRVYRTEVNCGSPSYLFSGNPDCGHEGDLAGRQVKVETLLLPWLLGDSPPTVSKMTGPNGVVRDLDDAELIRIWWDASISSALLAGFLSGLVVAYLMTFRRRKPESIQPKSIEAAASGARPKT